MPIYEYKCNTCGHRFPTLQKITAARTGAVCPACGGTDTKRVISLFGSRGGDSSCKSRGPFT